MHARVLLASRLRVDLIGDCACPSQAMATDVVGAALGIGLGAVYEGPSVAVSASAQSEAGWQGGALPASVCAALSAEHAIGLAGTCFAPSDGLGAALLPAPLPAPLHYRVRETQRAAESAFLDAPVPSGHFCATKMWAPPQYQLPPQREGQHARLVQREPGGRVSVGEEPSQPSKPSLQAHRTSPGSQAQSETNAAQRQAARTPCPFCKSATEQETERKTRMRRKRDMPRQKQRFGRWWRAVGYDGPPYCQRCSEVFRDHLMRQTPNSAQCSRENPCDDCARVLPSFSRTTDEELWARIDERNTKNKAKLEQKALTKRSLPPTVDYAGAQERETEEQRAPDAPFEVPSAASTQAWHPHAGLMYPIVAQVQMPAGKRPCTSALTSKAAVFTGLALLAVLAVGGLQYQYAARRTSPFSHSLTRAKLSSPRTVQHALSLYH